MAITSRCSQSWLALVSLLLAMVFTQRAGAGEKDYYMAMIGNSMQGDGIDFRALSRAVGHRVKSIRSGGAMSVHKFSRCRKST